MKKLNDEGITLIALVITIIILLILAGVSIAMLTGENGILSQAQKAKNETENAQTKEESLLGDYEDYLSQYANGGYIESKGVNAPVLKEGMELVTYNEESKNWDTNNSSSAYDYVAGTGTEDNNSSRWANAKLTIDGVDSYFVWIPRYAYKITYKNKDNISEGGTIDVKFLIGTTDQYYDDNGDLQTAKRATTGHEDTTSDYYIHPAFTNNADLGGWDSELSGLWVGKYESSLVDKETGKDISTTENGDTAGNILLSENTDKAIAVQPAMSSWSWCTIGIMYTNAKQYAQNLNSHMLKNSEWGAVAYLTESQYGRNGTEIAQNTNDDYITANGDIEANTKQSTTGNVYGIYDLSGCSHESVVAYYSGGNLSYLNNGSSLVNETDKKYVTVYTGENVSIDYKIGDATYETSGWHDDYVGFVSSYYPFFSRGGFENTSSSYAGIFYFNVTSGGAGYGNSFRMCLVAK